MTAKAATTLSAKPARAGKPAKLPLATNPDDAGRRQGVPSVSTGMGLLQALARLGEDGR